MARTTLQVPMDKTLRTKAERAAEAAGFSSVQEVVRVFLNKFSEEEFEVGFYEKKIILSKEASTRYDKIADDIEKGRNTVRVNSIEEMMALLE